MNRRLFLKEVACATGAAALAEGLRPKMASASRSSSKPNIILFFVDDNVVETIKTGGLCPNIRSLGENGVTFTRAYTCHGVCGPARFAVLTGRYMSRCKQEHCNVPESRIHGSHSTGGMTIEGQKFIWSGKILADEWNAGKLMQKGGYKTFYAGKVHGHMQDAKIDDPDLEAAAKTDPWKKQELMRRKLQKAGWDWAEALSSGNLSSSGREEQGIPPDQHSPEWRAKATIDFIEKNQDGPFFCYIAENLMHMPPPWEDMKKDPLIAVDGIKFDKPLDVMPPRESVFERVEAAGLDSTYSAALLWLDDMVGAVLRKLEAADIRDNTMVVFMQDNGHYFEGKNTVYQGGIDISPVYISWPAGQKNPGRVCSELVSSLDMVPTFMEAGGVERPDDLVLDGTSLMPIMKGANSTPLRDSLYAEMGHTRAVVTKKWKYISFRVPPSREFDDEEKKIYADMVKRDKTGLLKKMGCRVVHMQSSAPGYVPPAWQTHPVHFFDKDQLYSLVNDPKETKNLASNPELAQVLTEMKAKLREQCLQLPGTFGEIKTLDDCPEEFRQMIAEARKRPLIPVKKGRRISNKMPKVIGKKPEGH